MKEVKEEMRRLPFEGIKNARDLGGMKTKDGRKIRKRRLIKSGLLSDASPEDLRMLTEEYKVKLVVDLRTKKEREWMPEPVIKGISQVWNPLFTEDIQGLGVFKPDESDELFNYLKAMFIVSHRCDDATQQAIIKVREMVSAPDFDPEMYMARIYQKFVNNQIVQKQVKQFFALLANNRGGAVLWHCSAGKDRTGILTALLLYALGVPKEDIIEDYAQSAESSEDAVEFLLTQLFPDDMPDSSLYRSLARKIFGVKTCYIESFFRAVEKDYISVDNYLQKAVELHVDNIVRLKTLYLK